MRYHINPKTGLPAICRAKPGNCPYERQGAPHFNSYDEADEYSVNQLMEEGRFIVSAEEQYGTDAEWFEEMDSVQDRIAEEGYDYAMEEVWGAFNREKEVSDEVADFSPEEIVEYLRGVPDEQLIEDVLEGKAFPHETSDRYVRAVAANPLFPEKYKEAMAYDPWSFDQEFIVECIENHQFNEDQLLDMIGNTTNEGLQRYIINRPEISEGTIIANVGRGGEERDVPKVALMAYDNPNISEKLRKILKARYVNEIHYGRKGRY